MIRCLTGFMLLAACLPGRDTSELSRDLDQIAKTATVMIDGDVCEQILTERARKYMLANPSRDRWADADNYDVNDQAFTTAKKTLIRLSQLAEYPVDLNLWMPLAKDLARVHVVIRNKNEISQFWKWGELHQPMFPVMRTVLQTGQRTTVTKKPGFVSVVAPVRNSLGDIVALVEVVSRTAPDARENVK